MKRRPGKRPNYKNVGEEGGDEEMESEGKCQNDEGEVEEKEKGGPEEPERASEEVCGLDGASAQGDFVSCKQKREGMFGKLALLSFLVLCSFIYLDFL